MVTHKLLQKIREIAYLLDSIDDMMGTREYTVGIRGEVSKSFLKYIHERAETVKTEYLEEGYDLLREVDRSLGIYNEIQEKR